MRSHTTRDQLTSFPPLHSIGSCGSYLDGGANHPFQEAAIPMLEPELVKKEMIHLQTHFRVRISLPFWTASRRAED